MKILSFVILVKVIEDFVRFYVEKLFFFFGGIGINEDNIIRIIIFRLEVCILLVKGKIFIILNIIILFI